MAKCGVAEVIFLLTPYATSPGGIAMKLLNDFADEVKRNKMLEELNLVLESLGNITSVVLPLIKGRASSRESESAAA